MSKTRLITSAMLAFALTFASHGASAQQPAQTQTVQHVLLLSVDGLHALDVARYVSTHANSNLAALANSGVTFSNARTPSNSDSFPGLLALVTGGSPISTGIFYDVSYDRSIFDPTNTTCASVKGNMMVFDESIDNYSGGVSLNTIDPTKLPNYRDANGVCQRLYPHTALNTNTIFEVARTAGLVTAWEDKHPVYDLVNGPSGTGVVDLYTPEITNVGGLDNTHSVVCTVNNDRVKVNGILNEIKGLHHDGTSGLGVPAIFGMNFQAVSVGEKLVKDNYDNSCISDTDPTINQQPGGYLDGQGTPGSVLSYALSKTDQSLGTIVAALKSANLYNSTLIIVTAKHGQSPINPLKVNKPGHFADLVAALPDGGSNQYALAIQTAANCATGSCGFVNDDDVALIWLSNQSLSAGTTAYLNTNSNPLFIEDVLGGNELSLKFNDPKTDNRTPDIIVQPVFGTIYTTSTKKNAEHGGFSYGDTNVGLIVSNPSLTPATVKTPVATSQVAVTILKALGLDSTQLQATQKEGTQALPLLPY